jgi:DNA-binding PadR family transcriptional regulator
MSLRYGMLGMLADRPASGYDLLQRFKTSLANVWPATQSQIYTELAKLADAGLIAVTDEGPRGRKEYTITEEGLAELRQWLAGALPRPARNEMLLRIFFLGSIAPDQAREYLSALETRAEQGLAGLIDLKEAVDWEDNAFSEYGRIAMEWGERYFAMNQEWAQWALKQMPQRDDSLGR